MKKSIFLLASAALLVTACNNSSNTGSNTSTPAKTEDSPAATATETVSNEVAITINGGDDMKFDLSEIKVKEGQTVKLTLNHTGKIPVAAMGHNVVILASGTDVAAFAAEAINAKDNDYIPASMAADVIAHTKTIGGGESTAVEFTAPAKGAYDFLCSFPGHSALMKGKFIVE